MVSSNLEKLQPAESRALHSVLRVDAVSAVPLHDASLTSIGEGGKRRTPIRTNHERYSLRQIISVLTNICSRDRCIDMPRCLVASAQ